LVTVTITIREWCGLNTVASLVDRRRGDSCLRRTLERLSAPELLSP